MIDDIVDRLENKAKRRAPIDTGAFERKRKTGSIGTPVWVHELLEEAGWDSQVLAIEIGGRGVLHPELGWVSIDELREVVDDG